MKLGSWHASLATAAAVSGVLIANFAMAQSGTSKRGLDVESAAERQTAPATVATPTEPLPAAAPASEPPTSAVGEADAAVDEAAPAAPVPFMAVRRPMSKSAGATSEEDGSRLLHRLQAPFPDFNVVVCLAGCPSGKERIVFFERRVALRSAIYQAPQRSQGYIQLAQATFTEKADPTAAASSAPPAAPRPAEAVPATPAPPANGPIQCVAGCYSTPKTYSGRRGPNEAAGVQAGRVPDATWLTGSDPQAATGGKPRVTRAGRQGPRPLDGGGGSDWFTKRF